MAASPVVGDNFSIKRNSITVDIEEQSEEIITVKFNDGLKQYRGVLLPDNSSGNLCGVNSERIRGAPFWPPFGSSAAGINLKTIPCSTERYSYKLEGQPSVLTVFQPDAIKRSNRNQPAPQLSRILRPRRFVCRKCKKAYHVEEDGAETSSASLSLLVDRLNTDSSAVNSDSEATQTSNGKLGRRNFLPSSIDHASQSIRHVTPSIIPKLTEDYALSGRESEADSNSDDIVVTKRTKGAVSEPPILQTTIPITDKCILQTKRKADPVGVLHKPKKLKRGSNRVEDSKADLATPETSTQQVQQPMDMVCAVIAPVADEVPSEMSVQLTKPTPLSRPPVSDQGPLQVRKNRIKAQYVSVATPFRFPPSRLSKPNLFAIGQFTSSRDKPSNHKVADAHQQPVPETVSDKKLSPSPSSITKTKLKMTKQPASRTSSKQSSIVAGSTTAPRYRTRAGKRGQSLDLTTTDSSSVTDSTSADTRNPDKQALLVKSNSEVLPTTAQNNCDSVTDIHPSTALSTQSSIASESDHMTCLNSSSSSAPRGSQNSLVDVSVSSAKRVKATDYEKPKNRWIREARARRSQDERTVCNSLSPIMSSNPSVVTADSTSLSFTNRSRSKSNELVGNTPQSFTAISPKTGQISRKRIIPSYSNEADPIRTKPLSVDMPSAPLSPNSVLPSPSSTVLNDSVSSCLPVLKIKINRQRQPSSSANDSTQYEVVGIPVSQDTESNSVRSTTPSHSLSATCDISLLPHNEMLPETATVKHVSAADESYPASPSLSASSSRKGTCPADPGNLGRQVAQCELPDGVVFRVGDLVWSKLSGWPSWPAQITTIHVLNSSEDETFKLCGESETCDSIPSKAGSPTSRRPSYTACLHWFAWHQVSYMPCDKLFHFLQHCKRFDNRKKRGIFRQAVNEARQKSNEQQSALSGSIGMSVINGGQDEVLPEVKSKSPVEPYAFSDECVTPLVLREMKGGPLKESYADARHKLEFRSFDQPSSEQLQSSLPPYATFRRGISTRGGSRRTRGRRGGRTRMDLIQGSLHSVDARSTVTSVECEPRSSEAEIPVLHIPLTSLRAKASRCRGRGRRVESNKKLPVLCAPQLPKENSHVESSGTLKIVLSTSKMKIRNSSELRKTVSVKRKPTKGGKSRVHKQESAPLQDHLPVKTTVEKLDASQTSQCGFGDSEFSPHGSYGNPSSELLSQFPQVFPDLRASGILSDTVDIPTFSEDESEEEDTGRLIIDPDVMASVNVAGSAGGGVMVPVENARKIETDIFKGGYFHADYFQGSNSVQPNPRVSFSSSRFIEQPILADPLYQRTECTPVSDNSFGLLRHSEYIGSHQIPQSSSDSLSVSNSHTTLPLPHTSHLHPVHGDLAQPSFTHRLPYFHPSSHSGVPVTTSNAAVPFLTSEYQTF